MLLAVCLPLYEQQQPEHLQQTLIQATVLFILILIRKSRQKQNKKKIQLKMHESMFCFCFIYAPL